MNTVVKWSNISRRSVLIAVMLFIILFLFWWSILPVPLFQDPYATVLFDREGQVMGMKVADDGQMRFEEVQDLPPRYVISVYPVDFCGNCEMCKKGMVHLCLNKRAFGVLDVNGAFAEYICVPAKCCFSLSDKVSYSVGSLFEPLAVAYRSVEHAGELKGKTVLIVGAGTIGLLALACVKMKGAARIIQSDLSDHRLKVAREMGADVTVNPGSSGWKAEILAQTGGKGVDVAIEAVGAEPTVQQAMSALRFAGKAIWIGNNKPMVAVNMQEIVTRELSVQGSFLYGYEEFRTVVDLVNRGRIHVAPLISKEVSMEETPAYFEKLAKDPGNLIKVVMVDQE